MLYLFKNCTLINYVKMDVRKCNNVYVYNVYNDTNDILTREYSHNILH